MNTLENYESERLKKQIESRIKTLNNKKTKKNKQEIELLKIQIQKLN